MPCACGCGAEVSPDSRGRPRQYVNGHNMRGRVNNPDGHPPTPYEDFPVARDPESGCLLWLGNVSPGGYGRVGKKYAHRIAYERAYGPIPEGMVVDHVLARGCRHRNCVEPTHLEAVTQKENVQRQERSNPTHCPKGHPYDEANTRWRQRGTSLKRECRRCHNDRVAARKKARRQQGW